MISKIDNASFNSLAGTTQDVLPGKHNIQVTSCFGGPSNCVARFYTFEAKAALTYIFRGVDTIDVFDRFDKKKQVVTLVKFGEGNSFIPADEARKLTSEAAAIAQAAVTERRKKNLPLVRKVGTRICQDQSRGVVYVGYVESLAEEKVQIRISEAYIKGSRNLRPDGFSPSIIWDTPLNWELCE